MSKKRKYYFPEIIKTGLLKSEIRWVEVKFLSEKEVFDFEWGMRTHCLIEKENGEKIEVLKSRIYIGN